MKNRKLALVAALLTLAFSAVALAAPPSPRRGARSVRSEGVLNPFYAQVTGSPVATIVSCERNFNERERIEQCQAQLATAIDGLKSRGLTILYASDCAIDTGPNRFCSVMDSIPRAIGSITFLR